MKKIGIATAKGCQLVALVLAASFSPLALSATVNVSITGPNYSFKSVNIKDANPTLPDPNALTTPKAINYTGLSAGGFKAKEIGGTTLGAAKYNSDGSFEAFCADLFQTWGYNSNPSSFKTYNVANFGNPANFTALNQLADYYDQVTDSVTSTAFQLSVWEILFEDTTLPFSLDTGDFTASSSTALAISTANGWLNTLGQAQDKYSIGYLTNSSFQDLVYVTPSPVPLPAAAWLFGSALFGFITLSNRRKV